MVSAHQSGKVKRRVAKREGVNRDTERKSIVKYSNREDEQNN